MKSNYKQNRHQFLLTFFDQPNQNDQKEINGYVLNRYLNGTNGKWEVMIYTKESWNKAQKFLTHNTPLKKDKKNRFTSLFSELNNAVSKTA